MTTPPLEHLKSSIEAFEPRVQNDIQLLHDDRVTEERRPSLLGDVARNARRLGFYHALLGDEATGRSWFETAVEYYRQQHEADRDTWGENYPSPALYHGLRTGLLLGSDQDSGQYFCSQLAAADFDAAAADVQVVLATLARELCALFGGDAPSQTDRERVEHLFERGVHRYDDIDKRPLHRAQFACADAVADGDTARATALIEDILEFHRESVVTGDHQLATDYYSVEATVWTGLAWRLGIDVSVNSRYVPEAIVEQMA
jgi:hypothetical protein